jgi:tripartite-type tricarboxylate transporter receptor subunit TctC
MRILLLLLLCCGTAFAQPYPSKPVRLIVPYAAGGPADLLSREVAKSLSETLAQPVVIESRPGGGAMIGAEAVARSAPDGYTALVSTAASILISPAMEAAPRYDGLKDLAPVAMFASVPNVIAVHPSVPVKDVKELIAHAKKNPGKLSYGSAGNGSGPHLAGELFKTMAAVDLLHVPYKGAAPAVNDLLGGSVQVAFLNITAVLPHVRSGKLKALATTTPRRSGALPDLPSAEEQGLRGYDSGSWYGLHVPAATPRAAIEALSAGVKKAMADPALVKRLLDLQGAEAAVRGPEEFEAFIRADGARLLPLMRSVGLKKD